MIILKILFWMSSIAIVYSYILYPIILLIWDKIRPSATIKFSDASPQLSIVIAAYNEEKVIEKKIKNTLNLDYPKEKLEIIIASDGSDDKTHSIVEEYSDQNVVLMAYPERRGKVNVLNDSIPRARHPIIVLSDANTLFEKDAIQKLVRHFEDRRVGSVCGLLKFINAQGSKVGNLEGVYWRYETFLKTMEGRRGSLLGANGAIYAIRKELFIPCLPDTIVDDFMIPMKILEQGYKVIYEPDAVAIEETAKRIIQEKKRRIRIGAGDFQALMRLMPMVNPFKGFPAFAFFSHKVLRWKTPFFMIFAFGCNVFLLNEYFYKIVFILQSCFYVSAFIGQALSWTGIQLKFFNLCYYFVSMNYALFLGFLKFVAGTQKAAWDRTER